MDSFDDLDALLANIDKDLKSQAGEVVVQPISTPSYPPPVNVQTSAPPKPKPAPVVPVVPQVPVQVPIQQPKSEARPVAKTESSPSKLEGNGPVSPSSSSENLPEVSRPKSNTVSTKDQKKETLRKGTLRKQPVPSFALENSHPTGNLTVLPKGKKRYFVLKDGSLILFNKKGGKSKAEFSIDNSRFKADPNCAENFMILIEGGVTVTLKAATEEEREQWLEALKKEKEGSKKRLVAGSTGYEMDIEEFKRMQIAKYEQQLKENEELLKKKKESQIFAPPPSGLEKVPPPIPNPSSRPPLSVTPSPPITSRPPPPSEPKPREPSPSRTIVPQNSVKPIETANLPPPISISTTRPGNQQPPPPIPSANNRPPLASVIEPESTEQKQEVKGARLATPLAGLGEIPIKLNPVSKPQQPALQPHRPPQMPMNPSQKGLRAIKSEPQPPKQEDEAPPAYEEVVKTPEPLTPSTPSATPSKPPVSQPVKVFPTPQQPTGIFEKPQLKPVQKPNKIEVAPLPAPIISPPSKSISEIQPSRPNTSLDSLPPPIIPPPVLPPPIIPHPQEEKGPVLPKRKNSKPKEDNSLPPMNIDPDTLPPPITPPPSKEIHKEIHSLPPPIIPHPQEEEGPVLPKRKSSKPKEDNSLPPMNIDPDTLPPPLDLASLPPPIIPAPESKPHVLPKRKSSKPDVPPPHEEEKVPALPTRPATKPQEASPPMTTPKEDERTPPLPSRPVNLPPPIQTTIETKPAPKNESVEQAPIPPPVQQTAKVPYFPPHISSENSPTSPLEEGVDYSVLIADTESKILKQKENLVKLNKFLQDLKLKKELAAANEDFLTAADCKKKILSIEEAIPVTIGKITEFKQLLEKQKALQAKSKHHFIRKKILELNQKKLEAADAEDFQLAAQIKHEIQELEKQLETN